MTCHLANVAKHAKDWRIYLLVIGSVSIGKIALYHSINTISPLSQSVDLYHDNVISDCDDVMNNLPNGRWVHWKHFVTDRESKGYKTLELEEARFNEHLTEFRIKRGIHTRLWRNDLKCGLNNPQTKPTNKWGGSVGAWCDARSKYPCCSNEDGGKCGTKCECQKCVDMRKILHAEFAKWVPFDENCKWKNYTAEGACDIVRRFEEIHFVGDSFMRKMARTMVLMLRNDRNLGVACKRYKINAKKQCVADDQLYWTECKLSNGTFKQMLVNTTPICGMDLSRFTLHREFRWDTTMKMLFLVKKLAGKPGSLILLGVGAHMLCNAEKVYSKILQPVLQVLDQVYANQSTNIKWPHIVYMFPDTPGLLKAVEYRHQNGKVPCYKFTDEMIKQLTERGISYLDFRKVTSGVHSYDGTHHGIGVNIQKLQILFNYLQSLHWK